MKLKLMTYNVASGRCYDGTMPEDGSPFRTRYDLSRCEEVIRSWNPDILGINEINNGDARYDRINQTQHVADACRFPYWFFGPALSFPAHSEGSYGNGQASRFPYLSTNIVHIPDPPKKDERAYYEHRAIIKNTVVLPDGRRLCLMQTHSGLSIAEHQNCVTTVLKEIETAADPVILMGDFNMREWDFLIDRIREKLVDTAEAVGKKDLPTFPSNRAITDYPDCKIDYIFVSPCIKVLDVGVIDDTASDHKPLWAEIEY